MKEKKLKMLPILFFQSVEEFILHFVLIMQNLLKFFVFLFLSAIVIDDIFLNIFFGYVLLDMSIYFSFFFFSFTFYCCQPILFM